MDEEKTPPERMTAEDYQAYKEELAKRQMASVIKHWPWYLILGIVLFVLGIVGLGIIPVVTLTTVAIFGVFFLVGGILLMIAGAIGYGGNRALSFMIGFLYLIIGVAMLEEPVITIKFLTFIIGGGFLISGIIRILFGFKSEGGGMLLFAGALDLLLGGLILAHWPESSPWVIGLFVSIELMMAGLSFIGLSLSARGMKEEDLA